MMTELMSELMSVTVLSVSIDCSCLHTVVCIMSGRI
jgi:hypothetical protein